MDSKEILAKYLKPSKLLLVVGAVLVVFALVCVPMAFVAADNAQQEMGEPLQFDPNVNEYGQYCCIDVVGISNWLYKYDSATYYTAVDADWNMYTVQVSDSQYAQMSAQVQWWMSEDENEEMPAPYRLCGMVYNAGTDLRESVAQAWDIDASEYTLYFGATYLNANQDPVGNAVSPWLVGGLVGVVMAVLFFALYLPGCFAFNKCIKALEEKNLLDAAAAELEYPENETLGKDRARMSRRFLFCKGTGVVVPYSDVQWAYRQNVKRYFVITVSSNLVLHTLYGRFNALSLGGNDRVGSLDKVFAAIVQGNADVLIGYTAENTRTFNARRQAAKLG